MTERDVPPELPACPVCGITTDVKRHDAPHQGRFLCMACMLLFDGVSAEWVRPERERQDVSGYIDDARAALRGEGNDGS